MKKIEVSIQDKNTLMLQEVGERGDVFDLRLIHEPDVNKVTIGSVVSSIRKDAFNRALMRVVNG